MRRYLTLLILTGWPAVSAQDIMGRCLAHWQGGELDSVRILIPTLYKSYKSSPATQFFQAVFDNQGDAAVMAFESVAATNDPYAEESLIRLIQYQYAKGLYVGARTRLDELIRRFPDSRWLSVGQTLLGTVDPIGNMETAEKRFTIQAGAFGMRSNAEDFQKKLTGLGYSPVTVREKTVNGKVLYAVRVGAFATRPEAENVSRRLRSTHGIDNAIVEN